MLTTKTPATVYFKNGFGSITKMEGNLVSLKTGKYAQYESAVTVQIVPKGKRKAMGWVSSYKPYVVVLAGHGHPDTKGMMDVIEENSEVTVSKSRYLSFDDRYGTDFDQILDKYLEGKGEAVIGDYRHTKGFNSYQAQQTA